MTIIYILLVEVSLIGLYGFLEYRKLRRDQRDKKRLAKWLESRENRLSRERFWQ